MKIQGFIGNERIAIDLDLPSLAPVVTVTANRSDRAEALSQAVTYHQDENVGTEVICNTAMVFEYYLQHGEYPAG